MEANSLHRNSIAYYNHKESFIRQYYHIILIKTEKSRERIEYSWMLLDQCTNCKPPKFFEEAVATACYLQIWLPMTTLSSQTPFEKWSGIKPDLSHLEIFGSTAYSYVANMTRNKLEDQATKQIFVGYGDRFSKKGYILYSPITCKFQFCRSCIFDETSILSPPP